MSRRMVAAVAALAAVVSTRSARAFTYESTVSDGCHESIAASALRAARTSTEQAPEIAPTDDEQALIDDVPFSLPDDLRDVGGTTLLLAVRDNDLKGRHPTDTDQLAMVHGDPALQREHCLRMPGHDEPNGSRDALGDCVASLRATVLASLDGLGSDARPDPTVRVHLPVHLAIRGAANPELPTFYVRMGQALHTLQDGFTHTFRSSDGLRVRGVLNWIDEVNGDLDERRDGPPHMAELDRCDDPDALRTLRRHLAIDASREVMMVALDPVVSADAKGAALDEVLSRYFTFEEGCGFDNRWCDAPELAYRDSACAACRVGCREELPSAAKIALLIGALLGVLRRRRAVP